MYRPVPNNRDRAATIGAVVLIHALLGYALLTAGGTIRPGAGQDDIRLIDIRLQPPPPPPEPPPPPPPERRIEPEKAKPTPAKAPAAPKKAVKSASPVVAPKPRIVLPAPSPVVAAPTPGTGAAPSGAASGVDGAGTGAGGAGNGAGSGGAGNGSGGGGGEPRNASIIPSTSLTLADFPPDVRRSWPRGGRVYVAVRVQLDGRATDCKVNRSIGIPAIDQWTCRLIEQKGRFRPAIDDNGRPTVAWYGYVQAWTGS